MFVEMKKQRLEFNIGNAKMWLRYDIRAFYNIENSGYYPFDILSQCGDPKAVRCFLENGLKNWYEAGTDDFYDISEYVNRLMSAENLQKELIAYIQAAIILALPKAKIGEKKESDRNGSILGLKTAYVDVMKASEEDFMSSTVREAAERWERYAVAMGYKKPVETFSRFDDD